jgi:hypothetical protein
VAAKKRKGKSSVSEQRKILVVAGETLNGEELLGGAQAVAGNVMRSSS